MAPRDKISDQDINNVGGIPIRSEDIGFAPEDLVACPRCGRSNAPTRPTCLYCGATTAATVKPIQLEPRELEVWETGFNVIVLECDRADIDGAAAVAASAVPTDGSVLRQLLASGKALPLARLETEEQALALSDQLQTFGIRTGMIPDSDLTPASTPTRLRGLEFFDDGVALGLFGSDERVLLGRGELALIVTGVLFESRVERTEERKRRTTHTLKEMHLSSDTPVVDLYSRSDATGWRITVNGFDFSCLGASKTLIAGDNLRLVVDKLRDLSPEAKFVGTFLEDRALLEHCWPSELRKDTFGFQRSGFARKDLSSVSTTENTVQLTKFSRLQWHLL